MTSKVTIGCLSTGCPGLDAVIGGGLPEFSFNLIAGEPGSGKTTLAHQLMFAWATADTPALYVTVMGEPALKMLRYQQQFDFFDTNFSARGIRFVNIADSTVGGDFNRVLQRLETEVRSHKPAYVFVDSFRSVATSVASQAQAQQMLQEFMQRLAMLMTSWSATTFLIGEYFTELDANPMFTVADGVLWMHQRKERNSMVRLLEIKKMRGQPSVPGLHPFRIRKAGVEVFGPAGFRYLEQRAKSPAAAAHRLRMGVPDLDEMMGGGLPAGHSLLVAGPSGSGKTALAMAFLLEGVRNGETGVIASFEQEPRGANPKVGELIDSDRIGLVQLVGDDVSTNEVLWTVVTQIRRLNASRVVIDSLSGFELAIAPSFRQDFRESLLTFVRTLQATGVSVVLTCELEDRYTDLRFSPYDTAFLTDAIIVQRYIEVESRLRRMLSVVKVRASSHSDALREYTIDATGLHIGETLVDQEGLLGGRPNRRSPASGEKVPR